MRKSEYILEYIMCLFFPNRCVFCGALTAPCEYICGNCEQELPFITGETCPHCGAQKDRCSCNGRHGGYYDSAASPLYYTGSVKKCIHDFKFRSMRLNSRCLAGLMAETCRARFPDVSFDYVAYIPLNRRAFRKRGYNQSYLLARRISQELGVPLGRDLLIKLYDTYNQHDCRADERSGNLLGVFDVDSRCDIRDKTILLVDDVRTTGNTLNECGKMLFLNGARAVYCLTAALAVTEKDSDNTEV